MVYRLLFRTAWSTGETVAMAGNCDIYWHGIITGGCYFGVASVGVCVRHDV